ncbi:lipase, putative [Entamoeba histolytica KU27]|uniref:sn-1-specific diacylglycerol lipase n=1 Tax=Entamoeba histolytica KU27 TaxID=885311 RepID=M2QEY8_ENTHI|nr:lipase, putative [Entamoeba histolytica KU27]
MNKPTQPNEQGLFQKITDSIKESLSQSIGVYASAYGEVLELLNKEFGVDAISSLCGLLLLEGLPKPDIHDVPIIKNKDFYYLIMKLSRHVTAAYGSKHDSTYTLVNEEECNKEAKGYSPEEIEIAAICSRAGIYPNMLLSLVTSPPLFVASYYLALDPSLHSLILCIRGTFSVNDIVSDMILYGSPFTYKEEEGIVHTGMYKTAQETLKYVFPSLEKARNEYPNLDLIITGHSLGGGIATLITLFLNEQKPEWHIHCYGFAPAATLSENIAMMPEVNELVTSIVFDYDVVPSLSLNSCKRLIKRMNKVLEQVGFDYIKYIAKLSQGMKTSEAARQLVEEYGKPIDDSIDVIISPQPLLPGGEVYQILREPNNMFSLQLVANNVFGEIKVSNSMIADHLPTNYIIATTKLYKQMTNEEIEEDRKKLFEQCLEMV